MTPVRVMLVDDAVVVRRVLSDSLSKEPDIEIVGVATDGIDALEKIAGFRPEVVVLDVEMPRMDGIDTLRNIKRLHPHIRVVMFSTLTNRGAEATLDALALGADDYVAKPTNTSGLADAMAHVKLELVPKIKGLAPRDRLAPVDRLRSPSLGSEAPPSSESPPLRTVSASRVDVVVIAVSTGGPNALMQVIPVLPASLRVPVVMVQHIPPVFSRALAERLNSRSQLEVAEAFDKCVVTPGKVWIAPGDHHITFVNGPSGLVLRTNQGPPENSCRPAADVLFRSASDTFGHGVLSVVLTGMGYDGTKGAQSVVANGGSVIAQDQATSVVWGMPGSIVQNGLASAVLPLDAIANEIVNRVNSPIRTSNVPTSGTARRL